MIDRNRALTAALPLVAGLVVFWVASVVFPYHSINHDEGVYLQQAAMLLDGQLQLYAGDFAEVFRPWFFVEDGGRLYPKYAPVPAAMFAVSMALFGEPRVTLAAVAAGNAALVCALATALFDRRVGLLAGATFAAAPMAVMTSSAFLPYAPTTFLNLLFAVCYVQSVREQRRDLAVLAGGAIGAAFFARPYTAVLFAAPFVFHALWTITRALRSGGPLRERRRGSLSEPVVRNGLIAALGLAGVALALAYNAALTGSALLFPYEAFAPLDGPGFGRREILDHSVEYAPAVALEANGYALWYLATRWFTAGAVGTLFAVLGALVALRRLRRGAYGERSFGVWLLFGVAVAVALGNVPFWGTYNMLATPSDPTDGLIAQFGPFYHFDLLVPLSIFAAVGAVAGTERVRETVRERAVPAVGTPRRRRAAVSSALAIAVLVVAAVNGALFAQPLSHGAAVTDKYEQAYAPLEERESDLENALVFLPTPYGPWQNHPFQSLRNEPGFDGEVVYALDRGPASRFAVLDAYPERTHYRYAYRGEWTPDPDRRVTPKLEPLTVREGSQLNGVTRVGVPARVQSARIRLMTGGADERSEYAVADPGETITAEWTVGGDSARLTAVDGEGIDSAGSVSLAGVDELVLTITLVQPDGSTLTYRQEATVRTTADGVEVVWPPERKVCLLATDCGTEGTYLPDRPDVHRDGVSFETALEDA